jgi:3-methyladenine DNA glycosylase AlkD
MTKTGSININKNELAREIDAGLRASPNLKANTVRALLREFSNRIAAAGSREVIELALKLLREYEHRGVAYGLVHLHPAALSSLGPTELEQLGEGINSWDSVDTFAVYLAGPAWRNHQVTDKLIHKWAHSTDRWWRRAALASTVALNVKARGGTGDVPRTLGVCRLLVKDHDDMVVKALSWALRVLVKHDAGAVREFLAEHENVLAARVKREVRNKLLTGLKNPRGK